MEIKCDTYGWTFREPGSLDVLGEVVLGRDDDAQFEDFVLSLDDLKAKHNGWFVDFPERWTNQTGHTSDGAHFMRVKDPRGKVTVMEFTRRPLCWRFVRSIEVRYGKVKKGRKGKLQEGSLAAPVEVQAV